MELQSLELMPRATPAALRGPASEASRTRLACRCDGCGGSVTFDALIVSCACADEAERADSTLH